jgi:sialidase-1
MLMSIALPSHAAADLKKIDLFHQQENGHALYRIPGLIATPKATLLAYCEGRLDNGGDWAASEILLRRSNDRGDTWDSARVIASAPKDAIHSPFARRKGDPPSGFTTNNPLMISARDGTIHFLYCVEYARCFYRRSTDDGATFGEPVEITKTFEAFRDRYKWGVIATGPGHGIELKSGRLLVPIWMSTGENGHRPSSIATIYSDDNGTTWHAGEIVGDGTLLNPSENTLVERSDGRVVMNIRHESEPHQRAIAISPDGISRWSSVRFDPQLPDPICMASLVRYDEKTILFSNPNNPDNRDRKNLTIRMSNDDGATWPISRTLDAGPSGYSDLAVGPDRFTASTSAAKRSLRRSLPLRGLGWIG